MPETGPPGHATTDALSAYLDGAGEPAETDFVHAHLPACTRCSAELAELDMVRELLRRLPQVAPPRAFTLTEEDVAARERGSILRLPRFVIWTRAASAVAAVFFILFLSLDLLGLGADVAVPRAIEHQVAAPTAGPGRAAPAAQAPAAPPPAAGAPAAAKPAAAPTATMAAAPAAAEAAARRADQAAPDARVGTLTVTPAAPVPQDRGAATFQPLRLALIGSGLLALGLLAVSIIAARRHAARRA